MIDEKDRLLLSHLQKGLLLVHRPFSALGTKIGSDTADVLLRLERLKREGLLGGIRAFWDPRVLGYQGAWVAMRFEPGEVDRKAGEIGAHPGVVYIAERDNDLNFWFFIAVPPGHDFAAHLRILEKQTMPKINLFLPRQRLLKGADLLHLLDGRVYDEGSENIPRKLPPGEAGLLLDEIRIIRSMQDGLPLTDEPYRRIAETLGIAEDAFLDLLNGLIRKGRLRRIGIYPEARKNESTLKTLVAWRIPGEKLEKITGFFNNTHEILYADLRPSCPEFPYSVYTLIEAKDPSTLETVVRKIEDGIGKWPHKVVPLVREIKKVPVKYFPKELDSWWVKNRSLADEALQSSM